MTGFYIKYNTGLKWVKSKLLLQSFKKQFMQKNIPSKHLPVQN